MLQLTKYIDSSIFTYGTIAHTCLYITYFLFNQQMRSMKSIKNIFNINNIIAITYLIAHILISGAMMDRINVNNIGNLLSTILGVIGHSLLLIYGVSTPLIHKTPYTKYSLIFILGQIGMIIFYINIYKYKHKKINEHHYGIYSIIFLLLFIYYIHSVLINIKNSYLLAGSLFLVSILYLIFSINEVNRYYKDYIRSNSSK